MKRIVCAFDGSEHAMKAAESAADLARRYQAQLALVYVVEPYAPPMDVPGLSFIDWLEPHKQAAARLLDDAAAKLSGRTGPRPEVEIRLGSPANEVVQYAADQQADLIVVGSRGHGAVKRLLMGSVADRVVHLAHGPVLVVR
jgi:nucleotide-binding universal stress UspA family protein